MAEIVPRLELKVEIEGLTRFVVQDLSHRATEIEDMVREEIESQAKTLDLTNVLHRAVHNVIETAVVDFFCYEGGKEVITEAVYEVLRKHFLKE